jgi:hypothetical protein
MPNVEVSSVKYQYASNPNLPTNSALGIGNSLNNNWVGYIYHNIGHTNYTLHMTTVPYEF